MRESNLDLILEITNLKTHFRLDQGTVKAIDGATFDVPRGKTLCIVGESGSGKSMTARSILQIVQPPGQVIDGEMLYHQKAPDSGVIRTIDLAKQDRDSKIMKSIRGREIAMIFQEPMSSFSPVHSIGSQIDEIILLHSDVSKAEARNRSIEMLKRVGIPAPEARYEGFPHQLSCGLLQRSMIAMALANNPRLLIADEPTTALDVTTQAQILDLMRELQQDFGMAVMFITHDLGVVAEIADDVAVMYLGTIVERGTVHEIFNDPKHPYTKALLKSIPKLGQERHSRLESIRGMVPDPLSRPGGCPFHTRCDFRMSGICDTVVPATTHFGPGRETRCLLYEPEHEDHPHAQMLRDGESPVPAGQPAGVVSPDSAVTTGPERREPLLRLHDLKVHFPVRASGLKRTKGTLKAVDDVSFAIYPGETLGLVGESGSGKTTIGRSIVRALEPTEGEISFRRDNGEVIDLVQMNNRSLKPIRREIRMVFQDPFSSLNPRMTVLQSVGQPLKNYGLASGRKLEQEVGQLLQRVGLRPEYIRRYPHAFSGGERQRIGIARALALNPDLIVLDEAVSALDVSIRAQILNLLEDLQQEMDLTYLFISHDLSVVEHICDRVAVMYVGKIVELAPTAEIFEKPLHPYTESLMSAVPIADPSLRGQRSRVKPRGEVADASNPPSGCYFHPRCMYAEENCVTDTPPLREITPGRFAACHYAEELDLQGVRADDRAVPARS